MNAGLRLASILKLPGNRDEVQLARRACSGQRREKILQGLLVKQAVCGCFGIG